MVVSALDGAAFLRIAGESRPIVFTWGALSILRQRFGADFAGVLNRALIAEDLEVMAEVVAAGSGMSAEDVIRASPPIVPTIEAINRALMIAYHGPEGMREEKKPGPLARAASATRKIAAAIRSLMRSRSGSGQAAASPNF